MELSHQNGLRSQNMSSHSTLSTSAIATAASAAMNMDFKSTSYLPLMISALNQSLDLIGRSPNETFQLNDFDNPITPELFRKILIFLITQVIPDTGLENHTGRYVGLKKMNQPHVFNNAVGYDPTVDILYWTCRRIFDFYHDILDYQLLYYPQKEPKRVKYVLNFITAFAFFCDQAAEKFGEVEVELEYEFEQAEEARIKLEEVKGKLNERAVNLEEWKSEIPHLREKLKSNNERIRIAQEHIADLEREIRKYKDTYEAVEEKNLNVEKELEIIQTQIRHKQSQVVADGEALLKAVENEQAMLNAVSRDREELDIQQQTLTQADAELGSLIDTAGIYATELEEFVTYLQNMVELAEKKHSVLNELSSHERKAKDNDIEVHRLTSQLDGLRQRQKNRAAVKNTEIRKLRIVLQGRKKEMDDMNLVLLSKQNELDKVHEELQKMKRHIKARGAVFKQAVDFVEDEGPKIFYKMEKELMDSMEAFNMCTGSALISKLENARFPRQ